MLRSGLRHSLRTGDEWGPADSVPWCLMLCLLVGATLFGAPAQVEAVPTTYDFTDGLLSGYVTYDPSRTHPFVDWNFTDGIAQYDRGAQVQSNDFLNLVFMSADGASLSGPATLQLFHFFSPASYSWLAGYIPSSPGSPVASFCQSFDGCLAVPRTAVPEADVTALTSLGLLCLLFYWRVNGRPQEG